MQVLPDILTLIYYLRSLLRFRLGRLGPSDFFMGKAQDHRNESKSIS